MTQAPGNNWIMMIHKIHPTIKNLTSKHKEITPQKELTLNEAICAFQGQIFFCMYTR
jgi:hypothetical protein